MLYIYIEIYHFNLFGEATYCNVTREPGPSWTVLYISCLLALNTINAIYFEFQDLRDESVSDFLVREVPHGGGHWMTVEVPSGSALI